MTNKIYVLMCQDVDEMTDLPVKYFVDNELAGFWCEQYNAQVNDFYADEIEEGEEPGQFYYVQEEEIETTNSVDSLFSDEEVVPVEIEAFTGEDFSEYMFKKLNPGYVR